MLPPVPNLDGKKIRAWYSPTALAFLGDSVWEVSTFPIVILHALTAFQSSMTSYVVQCACHIPATEAWHLKGGPVWCEVQCHKILCCMQLYVRRHYFYPPGRITQYYDNVTSQVRAETQV